MKLTGEKEELGGKNLSQCHFVHQKTPHGLTQDRTRASAVGGRRLAAWTVAQPRTLSWFIFDLKCYRCLNKNMQNLFYVLDINVLINFQIHKLIKQFYTNVY
jgi:hypothetical protein